MDPPPSHTHPVPIYASWNKVNIDLDNGNKKFFNIKQFSLKKFHLDIVGNFAASLLKGR